MNNEKKTAFQQKRILNLEKQLKSFEQENETLEKENETLRNINNSFQKSLTAMREEHDKVLKEYSNGIVEINELRDKYKESILSAKKIKQEYTNKTSILLKQLAKQKK